MRERYMMVEAVTGADGAVLALVTDPEGVETRRFAGVRRDPALDGEPEFIRKFKPRAEVRKAHPDLKRAVAEGELKQLGPIVLASNHEEAERFILSALDGGE